MIVTRLELIKLLDDWKSNLISTEYIFNWVNNTYLSEGYDVDDWEESGPDSVTNEVLIHLDMLDINLVTKDDAQAMIEFLKTPKGDYNKGFDKWNNYNKTIDMNKRKDVLKEIEIYKPFCK